ncbi:TonB-dependent receptor [Janthinobacterium fluminis]|uniref:TonB-dependent receptor n=1 Tax=Janthinobacterium fluminis TaxID=2987524 RepID=A0ABT5JUD6_9BURK|nr:TonB-dependent receptor [Janthinobacterium fluminis]MDC8756367.1 TonB-dependent receptor [Janthinobacterium fluminis]
MHPMIRRSPLPLLLALAFATPPAALAAPAASVAFSIAAQPLGRALNELARQAGMVVLADARLTAGRQSPPLQGAYSVAEALRQLLAGSGLRAEVRSDGSIILTAQPQAAAGAVQIGTLNVQGQAGAGAWSGDEDTDPADLPYTQSASSAYIGREHIERFRGTSPADMFKGTAGVQVGDSRNSGAVDINVRGLQGQGRVPVLIDGSLQSSTVYRGYAGIADRSYIDPDLISSVRIDKGPNLSAQGAGAIGGMVSMQTLKPEDILLPGARNGVRLRGGLQSASKAPPDDFAAAPRRDRNDLFGARSGFGSVAAATRQDNYELVAAYSRRRIGNYFSGNKGFAGYQMPNEWGDDDGVTQFFKAGDEVLNTSNTTTSALLKGVLRLPREQTLELGYRYFDSAFGEVMPSQIYRNSTGTIPQWLLSQVRTSAWTARYDWKPAGQPLIDLKANVWLTDMHSAARNGDIFHNPLEGKPNPGDHECAACVETLYLAKTQARRLGADLSNTSRLDTRFGPLKLNYGLSLQNESIGPGAGVRVVDEDVNHNRTQRDGRRHEESAFVALQWQPRDWLSVDLGGRYQRYTTRDRNRMAEQLHDPRGWQWVTLYDKDGNNFGSVKWRQDDAGQFTPATNPVLSGIGMVENYGQAPVPIDPSRVDSWQPNDYVYHDDIPGAFKYSQPMRRKDSGFAPSFGVTARVADGVSVYLRAVQGLRMPSLYESTLGFSATYFSPLKAERSDNREIGLNLLKDGLWSGADKLRVKLAYFDNTTRGYITRRQIPGLQVWAQNFSMANADSYSVSGFELQSSYDRGDLFGDFSGTLNRKTLICDAATAAYLRTKGSFLPRMKDTPDCSPIGFTSAYVSNHIQPKLSMNATLGARLLAQRLSVGARLTHVGAPLAVEDKQAQWQNASGTSAQVLTRAYTLVDLFASYKVAPNATLDLAVDNLSDRYYLDPLTLSLMPGPGRTMRLSLGVKF